MADNKEEKIPEQKHEKSYIQSEKPKEEIRLKTLKEEYKEAIEVKDEKRQKELLREAYSNYMWKRTKPTTTDEYINNKIKEILKQPESTLQGVLNSLNESETKAEEALEQVEAPEQPAQPAPEQPAQPAQPAPEQPAPEQPAPPAPGNTGPTIVTAKTGIPKKEDKVEREPNVVNETSTSSKSIKSQGAKMYSQSELEEALGFKLNYPKETLDAINSIGGYKVYIQNSSKWTIQHPVPDNASEQSTMKNSLLYLYRNRLPITGNESVKDNKNALEEIKIMVNCSTIGEYEPLGLRSGLVVNLDRFLTAFNIFSGSLAPGTKAPAGTVSALLENRPSNRIPPAQGIQQIMAQDVKAFNVATQQPSKGMKQVKKYPQPTIGQSIISQSNLNRGIRTEQPEQPNQNFKNLQGSLQQANIIVGGIKIIKPKKQFGRY